MDFNKYKTLFNADEFDINSQCKTKIIFSKKLSYLERIKYFYIFNPKKILQNKKYCYILLLNDFKNLKTLLLDPKKIFILFLIKV